MVAHRGRGSGASLGVGEAGRLLKFGGEWPETRVHGHRRRKGRDSGSSSIDRLGSFTVPQRCSGHDWFGLGWLGRLGPWRSCSEKKGVRQSSLFMWESGEACSGCAQWRAGSVTGPVL